jgi:putative lipoic acid-binding regulatory protein
MSASPEDAEALAARLTKLIAREIADLERQRETARDESEGEKQARRIATLARSIDQLHETEQAARRAKIDEHATDSERSRAEDEALRASLAGRISRLAAVMAEGELSRLADAEGGGASRA